MSVYEKINKATGEYALKYIIYDGSDNQLYDDINSFGLPDEYGLHNWKYYHFIVASRYLFIVHEHDNHDEIALFLRLTKGMIITPYDPAHFAWLIHDDPVVEQIDFSKARTYTPDELEELYPSHLYDTVEVENEWW